MIGAPARGRLPQRSRVLASALLLGVVITALVIARTGPAQRPDVNPPAVWHSIAGDTGPSAGLEPGHVLSLSGDPATLLVSGWAGGTVSSVSLPGEVTAITGAGQRYAVVMKGDERVHLYRWPDRLDLSVVADGSDIDAVAVGDGGTVFLAGRDPGGGFVTAIRSDGTTAWQHRVEVGLISALAPIDGPDLIFAGADNSGPITYFVTRLGPGGEQQWTEPVGAPVHSLIVGQQLTAALSPGEVNVFARGGKQWSVLDAGTLPWDAVLFEDGAIAVLSDDGRTARITRYRRGGVVDWSVDLTGRAGAAAASAEGDLMVITSTEAVCLDRRGHRRWTVPSPSPEGQNPVSATLAAQGGYIQFAGGRLFTLTVTTRGGR